MYCIQLYAKQAQNKIQLYALIETYHLQKKKQKQNKSHQYNFKAFHSITEPKIATVYS